MVEKYICKLCLQPAAGGPGRRDAGTGRRMLAETCSNPIIVECPTIRCEVPNLSPGAMYTVTAAAVVDGQTTPVANVVPLAMPEPGAPALIEAVDVSSTSGRATAAPPEGTVFERVGGCRAALNVFVPAQSAVAATGMA